MTTYEIFLPYKEFICILDDSVSNNCIPVLGRIQM